MGDQKIPTTWYIAVAQASRRNFDRALTAGIWGAKHQRQFRDAGVGEIRSGDTVHFVLGPRWDGEGASPTGFPRIPLEQYWVRADEVIVTVTSAVYEDSSPIWDDDSYPYRFRFLVASKNDGIRFAPNTVSDAIRDASRRSLIAQGRAIPVPEPMFSLNDALHKVFEQFPDAKRQAFPHHPISNVIKQEIPSGLHQLVDLDDDRYIVLSSVGQGNWATVPWIAILDRIRGGSIQDGLYIVLLFSADMGRVVLALMFGVTGPSDTQTTSHRPGMGERIRNLRQRLHLGGTTWRVDNDLTLAERGIGSRYGKGVVLYRSYAANALPSHLEWVHDIKEILGLYQESLDLMNVDVSPYSKRSAEQDMIVNEMSQSYPVPFDLHDAYTRITDMGYQVAIQDILNVLLSIQVRPFVIFSGRSGTGKTSLSRIIAALFDWHYEAVAVSPAWADPSDLLGFISPLNQQFVDGALSHLLRGGYKKALLCLDEFNVAKVEHYFSDFISAMDGAGATGFWGPLVGLEPLIGKASSALALPGRFNVVATMNFDDSVQSITPRVLDRANVVEFDITRSEDLIVARSLDWSRLETMTPFQWPWVSADTPEEPSTHEMIRKLWRSLKGSRGQFGHRVAQEMHQYVLLGLPFAEVLQCSEDQQRQHLLDRQIVQRLLPKFHGTASSRDVDALMRLLGVLEESELPPVAGAARQTVIDDAINRGTFPRTVLKIQQLVRSYTEDGYASFW